MKENEDIILQTYSISKKFGSNTVLQDINLSFKKGEIHALLGENGAGKSTFIKILGGVHNATTGNFVIDGVEINNLNPKKAQELGISIIHQELNLVSNMTVGENIFLGREPGSSLYVNKKNLYAKAKDIMKDFDVKFNVYSKVSSLTVAEQQMVEIAKALSLETKLIIMDEPTDVLTDKETDLLFTLMRKLKQQGKTIIYISHRLDELKLISDRFSVFRDGKYIGTGNIADNTKEDIIQMMVGRKLEEQFPYIEVDRGKEILKISNLKKNGIYRNINFSSYEGEILGIYGLVGAKRTELMMSIFGAYPIDSGEVIIDGKSVNITSPKNAINSGIMYVTESRKEYGLLLSMPIYFNITLAKLSIILNKFKKIDKAKELTISNKYIDKLSIKTTSVKAKVSDLSGGNQQKVLFARAILTAPKVLIVDEPTRGVDVGARVGIYNTLNELKKDGIAIIVVSSDMPEVMGISDRILVMHDGTINGEFFKNEVTEEDLAQCAFGNKSN